MERLWKIFKSKSNRKCHIWTISIYLCIYRHMLMAENVHIINRMNAGIATITTTTIVAVALDAHCRTTLHLSHVCVLCDFTNLRSYTFQFSHFQWYTGDLADGWLHAVYYFHITLEMYLFWFASNVDGTSTDWIRFDSVEQFIFMSCTFSKKAASCRPDGIDGHHQTYKYYCSIVLWINDIAENQCLLAAENRSTKTPWAIKIDVELIKSIFSVKVDCWIVSESSTPDCHSHSDSIGAWNSNEFRYRIHCAFVMLHTYLGNVLAFLFLRCPKCTSMLCCAVFAFKSSSNFLLTAKTLTRHTYTFARSHTIQCCRSTDSCGGGGGGDFYSKRLKMLKYTLCHLIWFQTSSYYGK